MPDEERLFKQIADEYVDRYGESLLNHLPERVASPGLDARLDAKLKKYKRRRLLPNAAAVAAAACLILALLPLMRNRVASEEPALPAPAAQDEPAPAIKDNPIPIMFTISERYAITDMEQDQGQTVYTIDDAMGDDAVLTLEYVKEAPDYDNLDAFSINGHDVYGKYGADYSLLRFELDGTLYTMTCKYDMNTLVDIGKCILV